MMSVVGAIGPSNFLLDLFMTFKLWISQQSTVFIAAFCGKGQQKHNYPMFEPFTNHNGEAWE